MSQCGCRFVVALSSLSLWFTFGFGFMRLDSHRIVLSLHDTTAHDAGGGMTEGALVRLTTAASRIGLARRNGDGVMVEADVDGLDASFVFGKLEGHLLPRFQVEFDVGAVDENVADPFRVLGRFVSGDVAIINNDGRVGSDKRVVRLDVDDAAHVALRGAPWYLGSSPRGRRERGVDVDRRPAVRGW